MNSKVQIDLFLHSSQKVAVLFVTQLLAAPPPSKTRDRYNCKNTVCCLYTYLRAIHRYPAGKAGAWLLFLPNWILPTL